MSFDVVSRSAHLIQNSLGAATQNLQMQVTILVSMVDRMNQVLIIRASNSTPAYPPDHH